MDLTLSLFDEIYSSLIKNLEIKHYSEKISHTKHLVKILLVPDIYIKSDNLTFTIKITDGNIHD